MVALSELNRVSAVIPRSTGLSPAQTMTDNAGLPLSNRRTVDEFDGLKTVGRLSPPPRV